MPGPPLPLPMLLLLSSLPGLLSGQRDVLFSVIFHLTWQSPRAAAAATAAASADVKCGCGKLWQHVAMSTILSAFYCRVYSESEAARERDREAELV